MIFSIGLVILGIIAIFYLLIMIAGYLIVRSIRKHGKEGRHAYNKRLGNWEQTS